MTANRVSEQDGRVSAVDRDQADKVPWGMMQWLCSGRQLADTQMTFGYVEINPGAHNPLHLHPNSDEVLYLLDGELDHRLGDVAYILQPGMSIHIPQGVEHNATNTSQRVARMVVAYPTGDRQIVMLEEGDEGQG